MTARGQFAQGTKFLLSDADDVSPHFIEIAELTSIGGPEPTSDEIDYTSHSSPKGWRQFIQGLKDGGSVSLEGNMVVDEDNLLDSDEGQTILEEAFRDGDIREMVVAWPIKGRDNDYLIVEFEGFVQEPRQASAPVDDLIDFSATIKISGEVPQPAITDITTLEPTQP